MADRKVAPDEKVPALADHNDKVLNNGSDTTEKIPADYDDKIHANIDHTHKETDHGEKAHKQYYETEPARRGSVALNIVENPLKVSIVKLITRAWRISADGFPHSAFPARQLTPMP